MEEKEFLEKQRVFLELLVDLFEVSREEEGEWMLLFIEVFAKKLRSQNEKTSS